MIFKFVVLAVLFIGANSRYILVEDDNVPLYYIEEPSDVDAGDLHELEYHPRVRRGAQTALEITSDGNTRLTGKLPLVGNDKNIISAIGSTSSTNAKSFGLALDNVNGHQFSLSKTNIPAFGDQLTAAGKLNLLHTPNHDVNANAFVTRNMPKFPDVPNFNTVGGGLDYTYKNTIGASLGVANTDFLKRTDVSAMGNLNLWRNPTSSIDFNAGATRSFSPFIPNSSWEPKFGMTFSKSW